MKLLLPFILLFIVMQVGCLKSDAYFSNYTPDQEIQIDDEIHHKRVDFYGFGYWPKEQRLNASELCPVGQRVSRVLTEIGFVDGLLSGLTLNIYSPRSVYVACAEVKHEI